MDTGHRSLLPHKTSLTDQNPLTMDTGHRCPLTRECIFVTDPNPRTMNTGHGLCITGILSPVDPNSWTIYSSHGNHLNDSSSRLLLNMSLELGIHTNEVSPKTCD